MTELWLVTTDDRARVLGTIVLDGAGVARFTGGAEQIFRTFQKHAPHPSDRQVFQRLVERGWSNGPVKITPAPEEGPVTASGEDTGSEQTREAAMPTSMTRTRSVALTAADQQAVTGTAQEYADTGASMPTTAGIEGIMTVEGIESGDSRQFAEGALTWDNPPLPLMWQKVTSHGGMTDESVSVGRVDEVWRDGLEIRFRGTLDLDNEDGAEVYRQIHGGYLRGNSVDVDSVKDADIELIFPDDGEPESGEDEDGDPFIELFAMPELVLFHKGRIRGTTLVQYPAFVEAKVWLTDGTMVAGAVGSHSTATSEGSWDGPRNEQRLPAPMSEVAARAAYAWVDEGKIQDGQLAKTAARFIHHEIAEDGTPGAANLTACSTGIGVLNGGRGGTTIPASDRQAVYDHLAAHLRAADREPAPLEGATQEEATLDAMVAAAHTITIPDLPPSWWFDEPADTPDIGALTVTDEGRLYGYLAPANVTHRAFRGSGRRVTVPRGIDYSEFMNKTALAEATDGTTLRLAAGNITMSCEHASPVDARRSDPNWATQHYENSCSIVARVRVGENQAGTWVAGALLPDVTAEQVTRMFGCALSGDWQGGKLKGALLVPVEGFPVAQSASIRVADGALVASAVPVHWAPSEPAQPPSLRPSLERLARTIGRDYQTRMGHLRARVDKHRKDQP